MKKLIIFMISMAICLSLIGCKGSGDAAVTVMGKKSDLEKSYMKSIFEHYEQSTGKKIKLISIDDADFEVEAAKAFKEGNGSDILMHFNNADLQRFDVENDFVYLNDCGWVDDLTDGAKAYCTDSDGNLLGLPYWENSVSGCYYNKTILDKLGLRPAATQAEFDVLCQVLKDTGYTPICWGGDGCAWMPQFGLDPVFADDPELLEKLNNNEIGYADIPAVSDMVSWIKKAADSGWFGDDYLSTGWSDIGRAMASGEAVMTFIWDTWFYTDLAEGEYGIDDFALMPVFMGTAENGTYEGGNLNMMMVNKNGKNVDGALDFLDFCARSENYNVAFDGISTVSCFVGQTTNIQSKMVTDAQESIQKYERVSTAASRIVGYSGDDTVSALRRLFKGEVDVPGCVAEMDGMRRGEANGEE